MALPTAILLTYGYFLIFGWVLLEQIGLPLPSAPVLLAAGALCATEHKNFASALLASTLACLRGRKLVPLRPPLRAIRAAPAVQVLAGIDRLRPPHS